MLHLITHVRRNYKSASQDWNILSCDIWYGFHTWNHWDFCCCLFCSVYSITNTHGISPSKSSQGLSLDLQFQLLHCLLLGNDCNPHTNIFMCHITYIWSQDIPKKSCIFCDVVNCLHVTQCQVNSWGAFVFVFIFVFNGCMVESKERSYYWKL